MAFARKQKKDQPLRTEPWDPLDAVPIVAEGVEAREDAQGLIQVRKTVVQKTGLVAFLGRKLGLQRRGRIVLDAHGTLFWKQIDGQRRLRDIERILRQQIPQDPDESKKSALLFTKMLMLRHVIQLRVPAREE